jgi:hypothetical protein
VTVEHPPKTVRQAILRAAAECHRIAEREASAARVLVARGDGGSLAHAAHVDGAAAARLCEIAVRGLVPKRPRGRPKS